MSRFLFLSSLVLVGCGGTAGGQPGAFGDGQDASSGEGGAAVASDGGVDGSAIPPTTRCALEERIISTELDVSEPSSLVIDASGTLHTTIRSSLGRVMHAWLGVTSQSWREERIARSGEATFIQPFAALDVEAAGTVRAAVFLESGPALATRQSTGAWTFQPVGAAVGGPVSMHLRLSAGWMVFSSTNGTYAARVDAGGVQGVRENASIETDYATQPVADAAGNVHFLQQKGSFATEVGATLVSRGPTGSWNRIFVSGLTQPGNLLARADGTLETVSAAHSPTAFGALSVVRFSTTGAIQETRPVDSRPSWGVGAREIFVRSSGRHIVVYGWYDRADSVTKGRVAVEQPDGAFTLHDLGVLGLGSRGPFAAVHDDVVEVVWSRDGVAHHWRLGCL